MKYLNLELSKKLNLNPKPNIGQIWYNEFDIPVMITRLEIDNSIGEFLFFTELKSKYIGYSDNKWTYAPTLHDVLNEISNINENDFKSIISDFGLDINLFNKRFIKSINNEPKSY